MSLVGIICHWNAAIQTKDIQIRCGRKDYCTFDKIARATRNELKIRKGSGGDTRAAVGDRASSAHRPQRTANRTAGKNARRNTVRGAVASWVAPWGRHSRARAPSWTRKQPRGLRPLSGQLRMAAWRANGARAADKSCSRRKGAVGKNTRPAWRTVRAAYRCSPHTKFTKSCRAGVRCTE